MKAKIYIFGVCAFLLVIGAYSVRHNSTNTAIAAESQTNIPASIETTTADLHNFFYNYETWPHSTNFRRDDMTKYFIDGIKIVGGSNSFISYQNDMNGDGLTDEIIKQEGVVMVNINGTNYHDGTGYLIFANKGNFDFENMYKCLQLFNSATQQYEWYGDCAQ